MTNRVREPLDGRHDHWALEAPGQTAIELADPVVSFPPVFNDGFQVMDPHGMATVEVAGGLTKLDTGAITDNATQPLYSSLTTLFDGNLLAQNKATNPGFETNATGYVAMTETTIARDTSAVPYHTGSAGLIVTKTTAIGTAEVNVANSTTLADPSGTTPAVPGRTYTASAFIRASTTSRNAQISWRWFNVSGAPIALDSSVAVADTNTGWTLIRVSSVAPAGASYGRVLITWASCAVLESHSIDSVAIWDRTAFEALGWVFTNCTPFLVAGSANQLFLLSTAVAGGMTVRGPKVPYSTALAYEAAALVRGTTNAQTLLSQVYFYDGAGTLLEKDGNLINQVFGLASPIRASNFISGGVGRPNETANIPATMAFQLSVPVTAITQFVYAHALSLNVVGTVASRIEPVGPVSGLASGQYIMTTSDVTSSTTAGVAADALSFTSMATIMAASSPVAYYNPAKASLLKVSAKAAYFVAGTTTSATIQALSYSLDSGTTWVLLDASQAYNFAAAAGAGLVHLTCEGTVKAEAGITPFFRVQFWHTAGVQTVVLDYDAGVSLPLFNWLQLPA